MTNVCIICPRACEFQLKDDEIIGLKCKRGRLFAEQELIDPLRTLTTTVAADAGDRLIRVPVKSREPISLKQVLKIMREVHQVCLESVPVFGEKIQLENLELIVTGEGYEAGSVAGR